MSRSTPTRYVVIVLADGETTDVFGPYRTMETASREAARLRRVLDRENARAVEDAIDADENPRGPFETPMLVNLEATVIPITSGAIPVRAFGGGR